MVIPVIEAVVMAPDIAAWINFLRIINIPPILPRPQFRNHIVLVDMKPVEL